MLEDTAAAYVPDTSDAPGADPAAALGSEAGARWVSLSAMCALANVARSSMISDIWQSLVDVARAGGVPELGGRPVRMSLRTIRGVDRWCMNNVDARDTAGAFNLRLQETRRAEARNGGVRRGAATGDWLDRTAVFKLLGKSSDDADFQQIWFMLAHSKRDGRDLLLVDRVVRLNVLTVEWGRRLHVHRDDVDLIGKVSERGFRDQYLQPREIAAHIAQHHGTDHGRIARDVATSILDMHERTGRASLDGIQIRLGAIPKRPPGVTTCVHVSSLPEIERAVCSLYEDRVAATAGRNFEHGGVDEDFDDDPWAYRP